MSGGSLPGRSGPAAMASSIGTPLREWTPPPPGVTPAVEHRQQGHLATIVAGVLFALVGIALLALTALYLELAMRPTNLLTLAPRPGSVWIVHGAAGRALLTLGATGVAGVLCLLTAALAANQLRRAWSWWLPSAAVLARTGLALVASCSLAVTLHEALPLSGESWSPTRVVVVAAAAALTLLAVVVLRSLWQPTARARLLPTAGALVAGLALCFLAVAADSGVAPIYAGLPVVPPPPHRFPTGLLSLAAGDDPARVAGSGGLDWAAAGFATVSESDPGLAVSLGAVACPGEGRCLLLASGPASTVASTLPPGSQPSYLGVLSGPPPARALGGGQAQSGGQGQSGTRSAAAQPLPLLLDENVSWVGGIGAGSGGAGSGSGGIGTGSGGAGTGSGGAGTGPGAVGVSGLACASPSSCVVVAGSGIEQLLLVTSGQRASVRERPASLPAGVGADASLPSTACVAPSTCFAVGIEHGGDGHVPGSAVLLRSTDGGQSFVRFAPLPAGGSWLSLACPNRWRCLVGGSLSGTGGSSGAVAIVRRRQQSLAQLPAGFPPVGALGCHRSTCLAAGGSRVLRSGDAGATWSVVALPGAVLSEAPRFSAVDCSSRRRCAVAGSAAPPSGQSGPDVGQVVLLTSLDGGRTLRSVPMPLAPMIPTGVAFGARAWQITGSEVETGAQDTAGPVYAWNGLPDETGVLVSVTATGRSSVLVGPPLPGG